MLPPICAGKGLSDCMGTAIPPPPAYGANARKPLRELTGINAVGAPWPICWVFEIVETIRSGPTMSTSTTYEPPGRFAVTPLDSLGAALARNWWLIALRGVLAVIFGAIALLMPIATILALVLLFSAYMIVDGVVAIYAAVRAARRRESWGFLAFQGIASVAAGVIAFVWPGLTVLAFVLLIAAWSIVSGCLMLAAAFQTENGRWWLALGGAAALLYGILMVVAPLAGAVVLTWWLGVFAVLFGVALMVLALQLRARYKERRPVAAARPVT